MSEPDTPITLDQLRVFLAVVEEGSFSRAAKRLRRVQSAVSYSIGNLERLLEVGLFDRTGRRPVLTDAGRALLPEARVTLEQVDRLTARARTLSAGLEAQVGLAVDMLYPMPTLLAVLAEFGGRFPEVDLSLRTEALGAVTELVASGVCQLGVSLDLPERPHDLEASPMTSVELIPVCAVDHPLANRPGPLQLAALGDELQIVVSDRSARTAGVDRGVHSQRTWRVASLENKRALLIDGHGWGRLPAHMARAAIDEGLLTELELDQAHPRLSLVTLHRIADPPGIAGRWLLEEMTRRVG